MLCTPENGLATHSSDLLLPSSYLSHPINHSFQNRPHNLDIPTNGLIMTVQTLFFSEDQISIVILSNTYDTAIRKIQDDIARLIFYQEVTVP